MTLGDEEATRRGGQKTVLERKGPPTFNCGAEIVSKTEVRVHRSLEATVDAVLAGRLCLFEFGLSTEVKNSYTYMHNYFTIWLQLIFLFWLIS